MKFNEEKINKAINIISSGVQNHLNLAISQIQNISMPSNFKCAAELKALPQKIKSCSLDTKKVKEEISNLIGEVKSSERKNQNLIFNMLGDIAFSTLYNASEKLNKIANVKSSEDLARIIFDDIKNSSIIEKQDPILSPTSITYLNRPDGGKYIDVMMKFIWSANISQDEKINLTNNFLLNQERVLKDKNEFRYVQFAYMQLAIESIRNNKKNNSNIEFTPDNIALMLELDKESKKEAGDIVTNFGYDVINKIGYSTVANINGINYEVMNNVDLKNYRVKNFENFDKEYIQALPPKLRENIHTIKFYGLTNPSDPYWAINYNMENFTSNLAAANYEVHIYNTDSEIDKGALLHESGHLLDSKLNKISSSPEWSNAAIADSLINENKNGATDYGTQAYESSGSYSEDFAESVKMYVEDPKGFEQQFPNRFKIIKEFGLLDD